MTRDFESWFNNFDPWKSIDPFLDVDPEKIKAYLEEAFEAGRDYQAALEGSCER